MLAALVILAVALSFASGYIAGAAWRRLFADRGFGCIQLILLNILFSAWLILTLLFVGTALVAANDAGLPHTFAFAAVIFWPAALTGATIARRRRHRTAVSRRHRVTQPAGTHDVPAETRAPAPAPPSLPTFDDRPLPTPFDPSGRVPGSAVPAPPPPSPPPPPPAPPAPPPPPPPATAA